MGICFCFYLNKNTNTSCSFVFILVFASCNFVNCSESIHYRKWYRNLLNNFTHIVCLSPCVWSCMVGAWAVAGGGGWRHRGRLSGKQSGTWFRGKEVWWINIFKTHLFQDAFANFVKLVWLQTSADNLYIQDMPGWEGKNPGSLRDELATRRERLIKRGRIKVGLQWSWKKESGLRDASLPMKTLSPIHQAENPISMLPGRRVGEGQVRISLLPYTSGPFPFYQGGRLRPWDQVDPRPLDSLPFSTPLIPRQKNAQTYKLKCKVRQTRLEAAIFLPNCLQLSKSFPLHPRFCHYLLSLDYKGAVGMLKPQKFLMRWCFNAEPDWIRRRNNAGPSWSPWAMPYNCVYLLTNSPAESSLFLETS